MEESIKSLINWYIFISVIFMLLGSSVIIASMIIISWTAIILAYMFSKIKQYKNDNEKIRK